MTIKTIIVPSIIMRGEPDYSAETTSELLFGEEFKIIEEHGEFVYSASQTEGYEGFIPAEALDEKESEPTHKVTALQTYIYAAPDFKSPPLLAVPFLSKLSLTGETKDGFTETNIGGWVWNGHLMPAGVAEPDYVKTAERFIGAPYLWGGRTYLGIDCSGLSQISLLHAGIKSPRDAHQQRDELPGRLELPDLMTPPPLKRGDLVYFKRHVGIMLDSENILNATSRTMDTRIENIKDLTEIYKGIEGIIRLL